MNENYYEILEVNKNASQEIIDKVYKTLVKKYHPDLQEGTLKTTFEEKIKKINEAYDVLSNPEKRKEYDLSLEKNQISENDYNNLVKENINLKNELNELKNNYNEIVNNSYIDANNVQNVNNVNITQNNNDYNQTNYDEINKRIDNKVKYKKSFENIFALILTAIIILAIGAILYAIPATRNFISENPVFNFIINLFKK